MEPYNKLDEETLCFTLIGQFMWHWSILENAVDEALGNALDLSYMQMTVLSDHIKFMEKLRILTGAVTLATFNAAQRRSYHATIDSLLPLYGDRNIVAHHQFGPLPDKRGVTFFTRQTKKTVTLNEEFWTEGACIARFERLNKAAQAINGLSKSLEKEKASLNRLFALSSFYGAKRDLNGESGSWLKKLRGDDLPEHGDEHNNETER